MLARSRELVAVALVMAGAVFGQQARPRVDVQNVDIQAEINPRTQSITATVTVRLIPLEDRQQTAIFELNNALKLQRVVDGAGRQVPASRTADDFTVRISFPEPLEKGKPETLIFTYDGRLTGSEESPVYGVTFAAIKNDFAYLMYPSRWFPVSDYTVDRFSANMKITVPDGYRVIGGGIDNREGFPGSIAIVQGEPFLSRSAGVTTQLYFRGEEQSMAAAYGDETSKAMTLLTSLYGVPPQPNLTIVETEAGAPNGYSAPGLLFLSPRGIGKEPNTRLLTNQIARQWWGGLISPTTRNHIWINNAMARYSEIYMLEQSVSAAAAESDLNDLHIEALTVTEPPIIQSARLEDYSPEYWALTSAKGASVLAMLRHTVGDETFFKILKQFPQDKAWKSVNTDDFRKAAEAASGRSLQGFFIQWIESTGAPEFKLEYTVFRLGQEARAGSNNGFRVMGKIGQDLDTFRMPVELRIETEGNPEFKVVDVVGTSSEFVVESFGRPKKITIDPNNKLLRMNDQVRVAVAIRKGEMFAEVSEFGEALKQYQAALDVNRNSSLAYYRTAEVYFLQGTSYQTALNMFREALNGDLEPKWTEVWSRINMGKIYDITDQRERAINEYNQAIRTKDNTQGAQEEAAKYLKEPYQRPARNN